MLSVLVGLIAIPVIRLHSILLLCGTAWLQTQLHVVGGSWLPIPTRRLDTPMLPPILISLKEKAFISPKSLSQGFARNAPYYRYPGCTLKAVSWTEATKAGLYRESLSPVQRFCSCRFTVRAHLLMVLCLVVMFKHTSPTSHCDIQ